LWHGISMDLDVPSSFEHRTGEGPGEGAVRGL
jgi:hypothetical protein